MSTYEANRYAFPASAIASGTLADARIPNLATSKITSGTFDDARLSSSSITQHVDLSNLSASNLTSGTIPNARYGTPTFNGSNVTNVPVASTTGSFSVGHNMINVSINSARYIKQGRVCTIHFYGRNTSVTSGGGGGITYFTGLPFTSWNSGNVVGGGNMSYHHRFGGHGGWNIVILKNSNRMYVRHDVADNTISQSGSDQMQQKEDWQSNNKYFVVTASYITAS